MNVLFVCHGNICRSPMAEFVFRDLVEKRGLGGEISVSSAATSREELGSPVHRGTRKILSEHGISTEGKFAVQLARSDYDAFDHIIGMDQANLRNMRRLFGGDPENKLHLLLDFAGEDGGEVADPWYTGNFDATYTDVRRGCEGFLSWLEQNEMMKET